MQVRAHGLVLLIVQLGACATTHLVSGTAETITATCGTPPYRQAPRQVRIYRGGKRGESMTGPLQQVATVGAGAERFSFSARLPPGSYCLSAGGPPFVCDAELVVPTQTTVWVSRAIPLGTPCSYHEPPPVLTVPVP